MKVKNLNKVNFELFHKTLLDLKTRYEYPHIVCFCGQGFFNRVKDIFLDYLVISTFSKESCQEFTIEGIQVLPALNLDVNEAIFIVVGQKQNECREFYRRSPKKQRTKRVRRKNKDR